MGKTEIRQCYKQNREKEDNQQENKQKRKKTQNCGLRHAGHTEES